MTEQDVQETIAALSRTQAEADRRRQQADREIEEIRQLIRDLGEDRRAAAAEADRRHEQANREMADIREQSRKMNEDLRAADAETDRQLQATDRQLQQFIRRGERQLRELGKQIGGLGDKFGGFTEGLALPSMEKILETRFGATSISPRHRERRNGHVMELDVLATARANGGEVYLVEVKSLLRQEGIDQMLHKLRRFPEFFPQHRGKKLYGILVSCLRNSSHKSRPLLHAAGVAPPQRIPDTPASKRLGSAQNGLDLYATNFGDRTLAVVDASEELYQKALAEGLYLARIDGDLFELTVPEDFEPRAFAN